MATTNRGLAEAKALAQQSAEKAQLQSAEQLELRIRELKAGIRTIPPGYHSDDPGGDVNKVNYINRNSW